MDFSTSACDFCTRNATLLSAEPLPPLRAVGERGRAYLAAGYARARARPRAETAADGSNVKPAAAC